MDDNNTISTVAFANSMGCESSDAIAGFCASTWGVSIETARDRLNPVTVTLVDIGSNDEMILSVKPHPPCPIHYYDKYILAVDCSEWAYMQTLSNVPYSTVVCDAVDTNINWKTI